jgi:TetR/AcrR family transcriptional regulator, transcriptional repressor for nem operon
LKRLELWCKDIYNRQKQKTEKYGHVCGCPYASLGTELATQDEKIRTKSQELVDRSLRYVESALRDAKREGLVTVRNPQTGAKRIYSTALGFLLYAKIHNDLKVLQELKPTIMDMVGAKDIRHLKRKR